MLGANARKWKKTENWGKKLKSGRCNGVLLCVWPCIIDINNVKEPTRCNNKYLLIFQSTQHVSCIFFAHSQERKTVGYSMWYNAPKLLSDYVRAATFQTTDRQQFAFIIPHAVNHSLVLLRMGKKLPEICWADWKINRMLLLHLVGSSTSFIVLWEIWIGTERPVKESSEIEWVRHERQRGKRKNLEGSGSEAETGYQYTIDYNVDQGASVSVLSTV